MKTKIILISIVVLAFVLRFWSLGKFPALNADEASNSYDAYSLIQTGMDQHGNRWPITFQSFNDYKPGLYVYLDIPFVKFMGLTPLAARIPGALAGVLSVLVIFFLVKELLGNKKIALVSSFFLAISPWHIQFSRGGWEVNVATLFILTGIYLFLVFLRSKKLLVLLSSVFVLVLSLYTYHAARVVVPLFGVATVLIYKKEIFLKTNTKNILIAVSFGLLLLVPLVRDLSAPGALSRVAGVGLFADPGPINRINEQRGEHANINSLVAKFIHNKGVNYGLEFLGNWSSHFNGEFLFMTGDSIQRNKVPETGEMYLFDILFLIFGFIAIAKTFSEFKKSYLIILSWLLIAPIPSALTFQAPNALRAQNMVIPLVVVSAIGFVYLLNVIGKFRYPIKVVAYILIVSFVAWGFARYEHIYWLHMSKEYPFSSQYGVSELVSYISQNQSKYKDVVVTNRYDQPYILFLFYLKYPPSDFQFKHTLTAKDEFGFSTVADFGKYHFGKIDFTSMRTEYPNSLIIGTSEEIPKEANIVKRIYGTNGYEYFDIVAN